MNDETGAENIRQMKLINGDEIICDVVGWNDEEGIISVNNVLLITESIKEGNPAERIYIFRVWMTFQLEIFKTIDLNYNSVIANYEPNNRLKINYLESLIEVQNNLSETYLEESLPDSDKPPNIVNIHPLFPNKTKH